MAMGLNKLANPDRMKGMQDSMSKLREPAEKKPEGEEHEEGKSPMEIHDHGDGTFHTIKDGKQEEHPDLLHMTTHVAHEHEPESKHHHASHDGFSGKTHGIHEDGTHEETKEHDAPEEMGEGLKQFMGGEGEGSEPAGEEESAPLGGM
jgi:hypothetical protein